MLEHREMVRFIEAQQLDYIKALSEIKKGRKVSHWMWYIFPQIAGLGFSETSKYYALKSLSEAEQYLKHPILGKRLIEISSVLMGLQTNDAHTVFGSPDDLKLQSSMTLFSAVKNSNPVFQLVLDKFFAGEKDKHTLALIDG
jgi:uncharacterized protein (DUF1810 family)